jgi:nitrite reductase (NO-forming)
MCIPTGAVVGPGALMARVGQSVRLFFGNAGPNLAASLHLTGEVFDRVFPDGGQSPTVGMQTLSVPPGGAAIAEFVVEVPGTYTLVDHAVFRAFNKGAIGNLRVDGPPNPRIYAGQVSEEVYLLEGGVIQTPGARPPGLWPDLHRLPPGERAGHPRHLSAAGRLRFSQ